MILHVDMDAFYASVEVRDRPELAPRPVVVGGSPDGRGVVAAANYVARSFGVHSAMPAATAKRLCPHAVFLRPRMGYYLDVAQQIRGIFHRYTPLVEPLSSDEAFLDVTASRALFGPAPELARRIKGDTVRELGLVASVGVAPNKFLAKLASDLDKPDGLVVVEPGTEQAFLAPLSVGSLWGVGRAAAEALERINVQTIGQLRRQHPEALRARLGKQGEHLWRLAHGWDERAVTPDHRAKSISHETTFEVNVNDGQALRAWLLDLTEQVSRRLREQGYRARTVQLKLRFSDFRTVTCAHSLPAPSSATGELWRAASHLLRERWAGDPQPVRLLGMGVSGFHQDGPTQGTLFEHDDRERNRRVDDVTDAITARFGRGALRRGAVLKNRSAPR